jgi:hypothetical protein
MLSQLLSIEFRLHRSEKSDFAFAEGLFDDAVAAILLTTELFGRGVLDLVPEIGHKQSEADDHSNESPDALLPGHLREGESRVIETGALEQKISC